MKRTYDEHKSGMEYGDLKGKVKSLLKIVKTQGLEFQLDYLEKTLKLIDERLQFCGHCNGPTYEDGVCIHRFV